MSSLLRKRNIPGRTAPGRMWLGALGVVGVVCTVLSLTAAGKAGPADTAALRTAAARAATTQHSAATATTAQRSATGSTRTSTHKPTKTSSRTALAGAMTPGPTKTVAIMNYAYSPASLTVNV